MTVTIYEQRSHSGFSTLYHTLTYFLHSKDLQGGGKYNVSEFLSEFHLHFVRIWLLQGRPSLTDAFCNHSALCNVCDPVFLLAVWGSQLEWGLHQSNSGVKDWACLYCMGGKNRNCHKHAQRNGSPSTHCLHTYCLNYFWKIEINHTHC